MAQPGERVTHARQQVGRAVTILHVGWMDNHSNPPADGTPHCLGMHRNSAAPSYMGVNPWAQIPLAARLSHVENGIDDIPQVRLARPPVARLAAAGAIDYGPLRVDGVACITQPVALIFRPRDFSPGMT
jgi:hypothetical protein